MAPEKIDLDGNKGKYISGEYAVLFADLRSYKTWEKQMALLVPEKLFSTGNSDPVRSKMGSPKSGGRSAAINYECLL